MPVCFFAIFLCLSFTIKLYNFFSLPTSLLLASMTFSLDSNASAFVLSKEDLSDDFKKPSRFDSATYSKPAFFQELGIDYISRASQEVLKDVCQLRSDEAAVSGAYPQVLQSTSSVSSISVGASMPPPPNAMTDPQLNRYTHRFKSFAAVQRSKDLG